MVSGLPARKAVFYGNEVPDTDLWKDAGFERYIQEGGDLGMRMLRAFQWAKTEKAKSVVVIGSDCAQLTEDILQVAFEELSKVDIVIGPAKDGGYYLLGMNEIYSDLFLDKNWSTESVLSDTMGDIERLGLSYHLLPQLSDVDTIDDLKGTFLEDLIP